MVVGGRFMAATTKAQRELLKKKVFDLWLAGAKHHEMANQLNMHINTIGRYIKSAKGDMAKFLSGEKESAFAEIYATEEMKRQHAIRLMKLNKDSKSISAAYAGIRDSNSNILKLMGIGDQQINILQNAQTTNVGVEQLREIYQESKFRKIEVVKNESNSSNE